MKKIVPLFLFIVNVLSAQQSRLNRPSIECPQVDAGPDKVICKGSGIGTMIGTPAQTGITYLWSPSAGLNNSNIAQPIATPLVTTTYTVIAVNSTSSNLIVNGSFEQDYAGWSSDYGSWANSYVCGYYSAEYGSMAVTTNPQLLKIQYCPKQNHTPGGTKMLAADGAGCPNKRIWYQLVNVTPNTYYTFSGWGSPSTGHVNNPTLPQAKFRVRINDVNIVSGFNLTWQGCNVWQQFTGIWNSGNSTTALIEIFDDELDSMGNDFCLDDLSLTCGILQDQVIVSVANAPEITQKGVLEVLTDCDISMPIELTSNASPNCQWYENGLPIQGANNPTLLISSGTYPSTIYSVTNSNAIGCISEGLNVLRTQVNTGCSNTLYFNTNRYYCRNISSLISQPLINGTNPKYSWEYFNYYNNNVPNFSTLVSPSANNISPVLFNGLLNEYTIKAIAKTDNYTRHYLYAAVVTPRLNQNGSIYTTACSRTGCLTTGLTFYYGNSGFDNEYYDFGAGASPSTFTSSGNQSLQSLTVYYSTPGTKNITSNFTNNNGDCMTLNCETTIDGGCKVIASKHGKNNTELSVYPNPSNTFIKFEFSGIDIKTIDIYSIEGTFIKSIPMVGKKDYVLDVRNFSGGIYTVKMTSSKNEVFVKKIIVN